MTWAATAIAGGAVVGGGIGYLSGKKGKAADPYGTLNPEQKALTQRLGPYFNNTLASGPKLYEGQLVEDLGTNEAASLSRAQALQNNAGDTLSRLSGVNANFDEQFATEMADPTLDYYRRNIAPTINEEYAGFSTARANAVASGEKDVSQQLLTQRFAAREADKNRQLQAAGMVPGLATNMAEIAAIPRSIKQAGLDKSYLDYVRGSEEKANSVNQMLNFLGISTGTAAQDDTRWSSALAGAMGGAQIASSIGGAGSATKTSTKSNTVPNFTQPSPQTGFNRGWGQTYNTF